MRVDRETGEEAGAVVQVGGMGMCRRVVTMEVVRRGQILYIFQWPQFAEGFQVRERGQDIEDDCKVPSHALRCGDEGQAGSQELRLGCVESELPVRHRALGGAGAEVERGPAGLVILGVVSIQMGLGAPQGVSVVPGLRTVPCMQDVGEGLADKG